MNRKVLLMDEFNEGKVSRRDFHSGLVGMGLTAAAATTIADELIVRAEAAEPKAGGRLVAAASASHAGDTIDPTKVVSGIDIARTQLLGSRLIDFFPDQGLVPNLGVNWEPNADATQWTIEVLQGAEFHNGKTITATDVAYSFNRHLDPANSSPVNSYLADVNSIVADGDNRVIFNLKQPNAEIPYLLTEYHFTVHPEGQDATSYMAGKAVGSGPFMIREFEPGIGSVFERHANYHKEGRPYLSEVEIFGIPDGNSRVNALLSGEVDVMFTLDPSLITMVEASVSAKVLSQPGGAHPGYAMRSDTPPYDDNDVRLALKHAIDRERYLELAFDNHGVVGRDHPIPPYDPFWCEEVPVPSADPDKVKFHLEKAGHVNTLFELSAADLNFGGVNASVALVELMRENGVNAQVKKMPSDGYWSAVWMVAPWSGASWYGRPTANLMFSLVYKSDAAWNDSFWSNEEFDRLLLEARRETDQAKRKQFYCEMQMILATKGSTIIPCFVNWIDGYANRVQNLKGHPLGAGGSMYWDDVWLDDNKA